MNTLIVDNNIAHLEELMEFLPGEKTVISKEEIKDIKTEDFNLLVLPGSIESPTMLLQPGYYAPEIALLQRFEGAILGIGLGAEMITIAFEGELTELEDRDGDMEITLLDTDTMEPSQLMVSEIHPIGISTVPSEFEVCGYSDQGPEIIKHELKPIVGVLFHPEIMYDDSFRAWLLQNLLIKNF